MGDTVRDQAVEALTEHKILATYRDDLLAAARVVVEAAAQLIEAADRWKVAEEIEAAIRPLDDDERADTALKAVGMAARVAVRQGMQAAARIARGA